MKEESMKNYTRRVTQANRSELIVIMYEIILEDLADTRNALAAGDWKEYRSGLTHAVRFVSELMVCLKGGYAVSKDLMQLYIYVNRCLNHAKINRKAEELDAAEDVIRGLYSAFSEVAKQDDSLPLMEHTQKLYAGLTYGRGGLNETSFTPNEEKRGFLA